MRAGVIECVVDCLDRGAASGEFRSEINPEFFYTATMLMLRGCFVSSSTASLIESLHLELQESLIKWREDCIDFAISSIRLPSDDRKESATVVGLPVKRAGRAPCRSCLTLTSPTHG